MGSLAYSGVSLGAQACVRRDRLSSVQVNALGVLSARDAKHTPF